MLSGELVDTLRWHGPGGIVELPARVADRVSGGVWSPGGCDCDDRPDQECCNQRHNHRHRQPAVGGIADLMSAWSSFDAGSRYRELGWKACTTIVSR